MGYCDARGTINSIVQEWALIIGKLFLAELRTPRSENPDLGHPDL
jgi:hypothetical protein